MHFDVQSIDFCSNDSAFTAVVYNVLINSEEEALSRNGLFRYVGHIKIVILLRCLCEAWKFGFYSVFLKLCNGFFQVFWKLAMV